MKTQFFLLVIEVVSLFSIASNRVLNNQQIYCCNRPLPFLSKKKLLHCCNPLLCLSQTTKLQFKAIKFRLVLVIIFQSLQIDKMAIPCVKWGVKLTASIGLLIYVQHSLLCPVTSDTEHKNAASVGVHEALSYSLLCSPSQTNYRTRNFLFIDEELRVTTSYALPRLDEECVNCC